ncbi:MAG TPA: hypothetical protein GX692_02555 [Acholeplasmataceae bacterium]|nr:hypothetical protein [Acholeplasmataceae bacterium]
MHKLKVYSVHINRDVGCCLCGNSEEVKIGKEILARNLEAACRLNAEIAVFHLWDTYKEDLNIGNIFAEIASLISRYPLKIAYENVPISAKNLTQFEAWKKLSEIMPANHGFTLDLNWCSLYDNYHELKAFKNKIYNVHVQGLIENNSFVPRVGKLKILECLEDFYKSGYNGLITLELNRVRGIEDFLLALELIKKHSQ